MKPRLRADEDGVMLVSEVSEIAETEILSSCLELPMIRNSVLAGLRESRLADIQHETAENVSCREETASVKR